MELCPFEPRNERKEQSWGSSTPHRPLAYAYQYVSFDWVINLDFTRPRASYLLTPLGGWESPILFSQRCLALLILPRERKKHICELYLPLPTEKKRDCLKDWLDDTTLHKPLGRTGTIKVLNQWHLTLETYLLPVGPATMGTGKAYSIRKQKEEIPSFRYMFYFTSCSAPPPFPINIWTSFLEWRESYMSYQSK